MDLGLYAFSGDDYRDRVVTAYLPTGSCLAKLEFEVPSRRRALRHGRHDTSRLVAGCGVQKTVGLAIGSARSCRRDEQIRDDVSGDNF